MGSTAVQPAGRGTALLAVVATALAVLQVTLGPLRLDYGWDETVYVSQVGRHVPAAFFTAPRARGITLLVAPVAMWTTDPMAVRLFLVGLSALALVLAFRLWLPVLGVGSVTVGAALFASLWQSQVYGSEVYPNYWLGLLAVATVAFAVRLEERVRVAWYGCAACLAAVTLLRPGDAAWLSLALLVASRLRPPWRAGGLGRAVLVGWVVGLVPWLVEAQVRYGGVISRLGKASATEGGLRPHLGFLYEARALYGPLLCRPCGAASHSLVLSGWWLMAAALVIWWLWTQRGGAQHPAVALAAAACAAMAAPYMLLVGYSAPRFLLAAYALGSVPVGHALVELVAAARARARFLRPVVIVCVLAFAVAQAGATVGITRSENARRDNYRTSAAALHRLGVTQPCLVVGRQSPPIGFEAGCASEGRAPDLHNPDDPLLRAQAGGQRIAVLVEPGAKAPAFAVAWRHVVVPLRGDRVTVYVSDRP